MQKVPITNVIPSHLLKPDKYTIASPFQISFDMIYESLGLKMYIAHFLGSVQGDVWFIVYDPILKRFGYNTIAYDPWFMNIRDVLTVWTLDTLEEIRNRVLRKVIWKPNIHDLLNWGIEEGFRPKNQITTSYHNSINEFIDKIRKLIDRLEMEKKEERVVPR